MWLKGLKTFIRAAVVYGSSVAQGEGVAIVTKYASPRVLHPSDCFNGKIRKVTLLQIAASSGGKTIIHIRDLAGAISPDETARSEEGASDNGGRIRNNVYSSFFTPSWALAAVSIPTGSILPYPKFKADFGRVRNRNIALSTGKTCRFTASTVRMAVSRKTRILDL
ncbi:hypothetical protein DM02DRAFT_623125 [Periconia macrospinosa]|uniref:Uncharacterized protein n=1 Tax=Periconia macrospinosa TaxID=97972 RepID=A0A2V1EBH7_9PLEO|nr:hypothetical protein DM02DRAFT_623125 [Periconia macrospinosa]